MLARMYVRKIDFRDPGMEVPLTQLSRTLFGALRTLTSFILSLSVHSKRHGITIANNKLVRIMAGNTHRETSEAIANYLRSKNVPPTQEWMRNFMPTIRPTTPIAALQRTALFRILSSDLTTSTQPSSPASCFPANVSSPETQELKLAGPITVQVLDVEDIGHSRWSQVENIEAHERGEMTKGREIIRVVADDNNSDPNRTPESMASSGPHKLLLQDCKGTNVYAFEMDAVNGVGVQMSIGTKLVLKDVTVARGVALLEPKNVEVLGGKVDAWDKKWRNERKDVLKRKAGIIADQNG